MIFLSSQSQRFQKTDKTRFDYAIAKIIKVDDLKADYQVSTTSYRFKRFSKSDPAR